MAKYRVARINIVPFPLSQYKDKMFVRAIRDMWLMSNLILKQEAIQ
jgi:hypothetical protein